MRALSFLIGLLLSVALAGAQPVPAPFFTKVTGAPLALTISCAATGTPSSTIACTGTYTGTAPTSISTATWQTTCSGSSTITSFTASGGTLSFTASTPASSCVGALQVTDNRSDTATSGSVTISSPVFALVASGQFSNNSSGGTSSALNTTGATLLVITETHFQGSGRPSPSDSLGNTWNIVVCAGSGQETCLYYAANPTVGASQTFTVSQAGSYIGFQILAFSGVPTSSPLDQSSSGAGASVSTIQASPSLTPSTANNLVVSGFGYNGTALPSATINGGFTVTNQQPFNAGVGFGNGAAYLFQSATTSVNPTWTLGGTAATAGTVMAVFK
jgi:hypothetical protein